MKQIFVYGFQLFIRLLNYIKMLKPLVLEKKILLLTEPF